MSAVIHNDCCFKKMMVADKITTMSGHVAAVLDLYQHDIVVVSREIFSA